MVRSPVAAPDAAGGIIRPRPPDASRRRDLLVFCLGLPLTMIDTHATPPPPDPLRTTTRVQHATPAQVRAWVAADGRRVLTFVGYSGAGYQDTAAMLAEAAAVLATHEPERTVVNIGATPDGIGAVYRLARQRGFGTLGIVSSQALAHGGGWAREVEQVFVVEDASWGGLQNDGRLSPTSQAMVECSDEMVAIGGGAIARDELMAARQAGKPVRFVPAESNHEVARQKARKAGKREPESFGSAITAADGF